MSEHKNILTEGNVGKALLIIALPIIISNMLQSVLEIVDMYFIGQLGDTSIAGGTLSVSVIMVLTTVLMGIVTATAAFVSRAYGSEKYERIQVVLAHAIYLGLIFSFILAIVGFFWSEEILFFMSQGDAVIAAEGANFLRPALIGSFIMMLLMTLTTVFQSTGDSRTPMFVMVGVNIVNIIMNPTLIQGLWIFPALGLAGSAYASLSSRLVGVILLILCMYYLPKHKKGPSKASNTALNSRRDCDNKDIANQTRLEDKLLRELDRVLMMIIIAAYGQAAIAAYGMCIRLDMLGLIVAMGLCTGVAVMVGQNLGAQNPERAKKTVRYAVTANIIFMLCVAVLYLFTAPVLLGFFGLTGESLAIGITFMQVVPFSYFIIASGMTMGFAMNGAGATRPGMYAAITGQVIVQAGLSALLMLTGHPIEQIWFAIVIGSVVVFLVDLFFYKRGAWMRQRLNLDGN
jgi:putative MATE family efflux protein